MSKKKIVIIISFALLLLTVAAWIYFNRQPAKKTGQSEKVLYTCSMHPQIMQDKPGNCPICGMQLIKMETHGEVLHDISLHTSLQPANAYAISAIQAITITKSTELIQVNALGYTAYNTNEVGTIATRVNGRIEKLYISYRYQKISKGQKIMEIYSPELLTDQQNLLFLVKNDPNNSSLISSAKQRLLLRGFPQSALQQIIISGKPLFTIPVYSNYSGHIHEALENGMTKTTPGTNRMNEGTSVTTQELSLKEGMYVQKGQTVFKVYNPDKMWVLLNIYPSDQALIKIGNAVMISPEVRPAQKLMSTINFIEPFFREGNKTLTARVNINNSALNLSIGSQVKATIYSTVENATWLPREAVISIGMNKVVFIKTANAYKAQKIQTGLEYKKLIQIISGLGVTDSVAANAQYLIDSESFIKVDQ